MLRNTATPTDTNSLHEVAFWLLQEGWRFTNYRKLFEEIARRLVLARVPLWRLGAYIPTLDPEVFGDAFVWKRSEDRAQYMRAPYSLLGEAEFQSSPLHEIARTNSPFRRRLTGPEALLDFPLMEELRAAGATDYFGLPLPFADGTPVQMTFATDAQDGFSDRDLKIFADVALVLARLAETFAVRIRVERLLNTYLGRDAGRRVIAGQVLRGTGETIEAAIVFADLRDFTALSETLPRDSILGLLSAYFDLVAKAVSAQGGEILKFIGDGVLAVFPVAVDRPIAAASRAALDATAAIADAFKVWNEERRTAGQNPMAFGIAVHAGEVMYGNVGASDRLDFTVIGPVVNTVSRLQALCRPLETTIVVSQTVAHHAPDLCRSLGRHSLRGIALDQEIFALIPQTKSPANRAK